VGQAGWLRVASEHAIARIRIGFDIGVLVGEFFLLRRVLFELAREQDPATVDAEGDALNILFEAAIAASVSSYVAARDYRSRQIEAEHIAFLTHELRNPLSVATLALDRLRRVQTAGDRANLIAQIEKGQQRVASLIDRVLAAESLEVGARPARPVDTELGPLLDQALLAAHAAATDKHVGFEITLDPSRDTTLRVDPALAAAALQNVFDNAVKFTDEGRIEVHVADELDRVVVEVHDNCDGLSDEELRILFVPFKRGASRRPGAGLGLAIARRAIEATGGTIRAESGGERGCTFWLALPKAPH
jgi:signal transduction histidine kinase